MTSRETPMHRHATTMAGFLLACGSAFAQEATNTPAATQPAAGHVAIRERVQYVNLSDDPSPHDRDIAKVVATTTLSYGLRRDVAATLDVPVAFVSVESTHDGGDDFGINDLALSLKYRPFQTDLGPVDSVRLAFIGGVEIPSGDGDFSSHSFDPFAGTVFTAILGRHGVNQSISYKFNTGGDEFTMRAGDGQDDALRYDTAYLFRVSPATYAADTSAALYATVELNGIYETNGDNEALLGPGLLYEAKTFAAEATVGLPVVQDVTDRPETDLTVTFGLRLLF
jgi:hypothetical protein